MMPVAWRVRHSKNGVPALNFGLSTSREGPKACTVNHMNTYTPTPPNCKSELKESFV
jgi:hypothetical protein